MSKTQIHTMSGQLGPKRIVSGSGGAASFAVAAMLCEKYGPKEVVVVFCDTNAENEDLYRFLFEGIVKLGCYFYYINEGYDIWESYRRNRYYANTRTAHCTEDLKKAPFKKHMLEQFPPELGYTLYFGFDWKEKHRHYRAVINHAPYAVESPLTEPPFLSRQQVFQYLDDYDIEVPELYKMGFSHNNCDGKCPKAGQGHWARLLKTAPSKYADAEQKQNQLFAEIPTMRAPLRMRINKVMHYLTLTQFREHIQSGGECDMFDVGGCGCFSDD